MVVISRILLSSLFLLALSSGTPGPSAPVPAAPEFLARAIAPLDYILAKVKDHRIVLLGEAHWIRHDATLVAGLVPRLPAAGVTALAMEVLPASRQARLDALMAAPEWDSKSAMEVMRTAEWPYREYLEIVRAAWKVNRDGGKLRLLALGPGRDWRETLLPKGQTYETYMADLVTQYLAGPDTRVVLYCGLNHAFTRFHQPEMPRLSRVEAFFDRTGNLLWRRFGEDAFLIVLHHPWRCNEAGKPARCLPAGGAIDCAAGRPGRAAGFDLRGSPFAQSRLEGFEYALGYPDLRLVDMADGYIWQMPIQEYRGVTMIPLAEFAPDAAALAEVSDHSPFADEKGSTREQLEKQWRDQEDWLRDSQKTRGWEAAAPKCGK